MIPEDDPRWTSLAAGYRLPYDARPVLRKIKADASDAAAWQELWNELHHQGDVGEASYLAVVALASMLDSHPLPRTHLYGLVTTIEVERHRRTNPSLPHWLSEEYRHAWKRLVACALDDLKTSADPDALQLALAVLALGKGLVQIGALIWYQDTGTVEEYLNERLAWADLYWSDAG